MPDQRLFSPESVRIRPAQFVSTAVLFLSCALIAPSIATSQEPQTSATPQTTPHRHLRTSPKAAAQIPPPAPAPVTPPAPRWPANDRPAPASVVMDATGLRITATNASLQQILDAFARTTGTKIDGSVQDQRVFGDFGPGKPREVLSQLLVGSGYNFLLVGDAGQGAPREIVLSSRRTGATAQQASRPAQDDNEDDYVDNSNNNEPDPTPPPQPPPVQQPPQQNGQPVRTPQQLMQEIQQRQQMMQQQNQQQPTPQNQ